MVGLADEGRGRLSNQPVRDLGRPGADLLPATRPHPGDEYLSHLRRSQMALMRYDPFRELDRLTEQLWGLQGKGGTMMPMDAYRRGDRFVVSFDLPGVDPGSIDVTVERNVLTVKADRSPSSRDGDDIVVAERPQGSFSRQLFLGDNLDTDHVEAHYEQGVLTLSIPVAEVAKPKKVEISAADHKQPVLA
jgi:HSP20 family protein